MPEVYKLTLSLQERKAIDGIGNSYPHGYELFRLLWIESKVEGESEEFFEIESWVDEKDITFLIPESVAWEIDAIGLGSTYQWDCFSDELVIKLNEFCHSLV